MSAGETVEPTIRNLRFRGWDGLLWILGWGVIWIPAAAWADSGFPPHRYLRVLPVVVLALASYAVVIVALSRLPIQRLRLGDRLRAGPVGWLEPRDIAVIRFACDPEEDYDDAHPPGASCLVAIEHCRGRPVRLTASRIDASRLRDWAEGKAIAICDFDD